jgi:Fe-S-cluster-containing dehydrogenase component
MSTKQWAMIVDVEKCEACYNCFLAVKDEHIDNRFPGYSEPMPLHGQNWVEIERCDRGTAPIVSSHSMPIMCNQCDDAPCIKAASDGAMYKRPDGIVMIDPDKAKGQRQLVGACPYGHIHWNEELQVPQKWNFDAHLLDQGWARTRGEQVCGTGALKSMKISYDKLDDLCKSEGLEVLHPEYRTKPRIFYKNLHLMTSAFIAGTIISNETGVEECVAQTTVFLYQNEKVVAQVQTDAFGEFKFDGLKKGSGAYVITLIEDGPVLKKVSLEDESIYVGCLEA